MIRKLTALIHNIFIWSATQFLPTNEKKLKHVLKPLMRKSLSTNKPNLTKIRLPTPKVMHINGLLARRVGETPNATSTLIHQESTQLVRD